MESTMTISDLVHDGSLKVATQPPSNWRDIERASSLTIPLIAEDYPAKTAVMWNETYQQFGMPDKNCMMIADPKDTGRIMEAFRHDQTYRGGGAGVGFKEVVMDYLDEVTPLAKAMGAVNIIKRLHDGTLVGDNTDGVGYAESLQKALGGRHKTLKGVKVLMLGAGGSGRAIAFALAKMEAHIIILNRTKEKAVQLAWELNSYFGKAVAEGGGRESITEALPLVDAVVSVVDDAHSPLDAYSTLGPMTLPVTPESVRENEREAEKLLRSARPSLIVSDIRIRKETTPTLAQAEKLGFTTLDGIPMVVNQGVAAFWWMYQKGLTKRGVELADIEKVMWKAAQS